MKCALAHTSPRAGHGLEADAEPIAERHGRFAGFYAPSRTVDNVKIHRADPTPRETQSPTQPPVRLLGGIASVFLLSIVAVVLTALDRADRARIEHAVVKGPRRSPEVKPWTAAMSARSIDAQRIPRTVRHAEHHAA